MLAWKTMMNPAAVSASGSEPDVLGNPVPLPPTPSLFLPIMDQLESSSFLRAEQLTSSYNMEANVPAVLAPNSYAAADYTSHFGHDHDILHFYPPASHYLDAGNPYSHFSESTFLPTPQDYYFPTLLEENMGIFGVAPHAPMGISYGGGYRAYYLPARGGYAYGHYPLRCQVEGCMADLSKAKRYHRRHRVCEQHSKAPVVIITGAIMPQRFCQQCSRFHEVDEFDDAKKSCRQRLADHNRRRRKPKMTGTNVQLKRRVHVKKSATAKDNGGSSKSMANRDIMEGSASMEYDQSLSHGEMARELVDPKGKAPMEQQECIPQRIPQHAGSPFVLPPSSGTCSPLRQPVSGGNTSNIGPVQETCLALHQYHQHGNIMQLGQAVFDLDFNQ